MDIAAFQLALKARAAADTGAGGLFNATAPLINGWYPNQVPKIDPPYCVANIASAVSDNAFTKDVVPVTFRVSTFHEREKDGVDTYGACSSILKRIYGDSSNASAPSYGFHRHVLVIASGTWTGGIVEHVSTQEEHEDQWWHFIQSFRLWLTQ